MDSRTTPQRPGGLGTLLSRFDVALLMTRREDDPLRLRGRPIRIAEVDALDQVWFFAPMDCESLREAIVHEDAYLIWQSPSQQIVIHGALDFSQRRDRIDALWIDDDHDLPLPEGRADPNACLVRLTPRAADVWQLAPRAGLSPSEGAVLRPSAGNTQP